MLEILYLEHAATGTRILPTPPCYCPHPDTAKDLSLNLAAHVDARLMPPNNKASRPSFKMFPRFQPSSFPANASSNKPRIHFFISARSRAYDAPSYLSRSWRSKLAELGYPPFRSKPCSIRHSRRKADLPWIARARRSKWPCSTPAWGARAIHLGLGVEPGFGFFWARAPFFLFFF